MALRIDFNCIGCGKLGHATIPTDAEYQPTHCIECNLKAPYRPNFARMMLEAGSETFDAEKNRLRAENTLLRAVYEAADNMMCADDDISDELARAIHAVREFKEK